jgi:site-specific recombinase XerC
LFDYLVTGGVLVSTPAGSVRGPKYVVTRGKTPVLSGAEMRQLLKSIDTGELIGLRDRALLGLWATLRPRQCHRHASGGGQFSGGPAFVVEGS